MYVYNYKYRINSAYPFICHFPPCFNGLAIPNGYSYPHNDYHPLRLLCRYFFCKTLCSCRWNMNISSFIIPIFIIFVLVFALFKRCDIWTSFTKGGSSGFQCAVNILPSLVGLVVGIEILSASGALAAFSNLIAPLCETIGIPKEIFPLSMMRSISGSGSMALFQNLLSTYTPDSYIGRCASVIMGSTETTFYTLSIYFAATRAKKLRYCVLCALLADLTGSIVACLLCKFI